MLPMHCKHVIVNIEHHPAARKIQHVAERLAMPLPAQDLYIIWPNKVLQQLLLSEAACSPLKVFRLYSALFMLPLQI